MFTVINLYHFPCPTLSLHSRNLDIEYVNVCKRTSTSDGHGLAVTVKDQAECRIYRIITNPAPEFSPLPSSCFHPCNVSDKHEICIIIVISNGTTREKSWAKSMGPSLGKYVYHPAVNFSWNTNKYKIEGESLFNNRMGYIVPLRA